VVDAFARACGLGLGETLNVGTGVATSVVDIYMLLDERWSATEASRGSARFPLVTSGGWHCPLKRPSRPAVGSHTLSFSKGSPERWPGCLAANR
jgi:hypothetical protein